LPKAQKDQQQLNLHQLKYFINALPKNAGEAFHIGAGVSSIIMDLKDKVVNAGDWFNESTEKGYCWLESGKFLLLIEKVLMPL
jgi:hypothetical protein